MLQRRGGLDLAQEPLGTKRRGELRVEHFDRDEPVVRRVAREIDDGHAAAADLPLDGVAAGKCSGQLGGDPHWREAFTRESRFR